MTVKLHETINSIGVIASIALGLYAAVAANMQEQEDLAVSATLIEKDDPDMRLVDGCAEEYARWGKEPPYARPNVISCGYQLWPITWQVTINNRSNRPATILRATALVVMSYLDDRGGGKVFIGRDDGTEEPVGPDHKSLFPIPLNLDANKAVAFVVARKIWVTIAKQDYDRCVAARGLRAVELCLGWYWHGPKANDFRKYPRQERVQLELISSTGRTYNVALEPFRP